MAKPKILLVEAFGIGVHHNTAEREDNFSRETRTGVEHLRMIFEQAGRADFAKGLISAEQFLVALNASLRSPITMSELVCLWTSTYEVQHDLRGDLAARGLPPYVWCSTGSDVDRDWMRARGIHNWSGCRGLFMSGPGRDKSRRAYYDLLRLELSKVLCQELAFSDIAMVDTSMDAVTCARSLGIDANLVLWHGVRGILKELRAAA